MKTGWGRARARQIPLALAHRPAHTRDDLIVTPANREAAALVDRWPDWPSNLAVLVGPAGAGKSHLAAVWRERSGALAFAPPDVGRFQPAEGGSVPPVLIDDADGASLDETGLFHLLNASRAAGSTVLMTARTPPASWNIGLADLRSRLRAAAFAVIGAPDDALLEGVIAKLFADRQVEVDPHVVQFVARRLERSLVAAIQVVGDLDRAALERKSPITRSLAAEVLKAPPIGPEDAQA